MIKTLAQQSTRLLSRSEGAASAMSGASIPGKASLSQWPALLLARRLKAEASGRDVDATGKDSSKGMIDIRLAGPGDPKLPQQIFPTLRWGGLIACIDPERRRIEQLAEQYDGRNGFILENRLDSIWAGPAGMRLPGITPRGWYFIARKRELIPPGETTDRSTYTVTLEADDNESEGYFVRKEVPSVQSMTVRLLRRFSDLNPEDAQKRAERLVHQVFPIFLTRETKVLQALQKKLPQAYRHRVPKPLRIAKNAEGFVTRLDMNWLRNGGRPITQLRFAKEAAELLTVLHERARVMHLDLRLDNMVVTNHGVGFVDFGSAAHVGEKLERSPVLQSLFSEMMHTSQVHRMLGKMLEKGHVTNQAISEVHGKVDSTVDAFYLAVQINQPHQNPEFTRLIKYDPESKDAKSLAALTAAILRPKDPSHAEYKKASDLLRGIRRIHLRG